MKETEKSVEYIFPNEDQIHLIGGAVDLINYYNQQGLVLPVTLEKYLQLAKQKKLIVAAIDEEEVIGTVAYTYEYPRDIWEVGGMAVNEGWLHQGIATVLIQEIIKKRPHGKTIAMANKNSLPLFKKVGAQEISFPNSLPPEIFGPCSLCPVKPEKGCCDTLLSLAPVVFKFVFEGASERQILRLMMGIGDKQSPEYAGIETPAEQW